MKIIVSHDVDHLFRNDHYKDLTYPKLWIRSTAEFIKREYGTKEWLRRMCSPIYRKQNYIFDVMEFDRQYQVPSAFFFGMEKGLGMSYEYSSVKDIAKQVEDAGFDIGVHGISFEHFPAMKKEHDRFLQITNRKNFGIRIHYVRFAQNTFSGLERCGYLFDSTEFDKEKGYLIKEPYKVGQMWEFPLTIMDGYLPKKIEDKKLRTLDIVEKARKQSLSYLTLLFHDCYFCDAYIAEKEWYKWIIQWFDDNGYEFISYRDAISELEKK